MRPPSCVPPIVVSVHSETCCNVQLFLDGSNDRRHIPVDGTVGLFSHTDCDHGLAWCTSLLEGAELGQWRWPARPPTQAPKAPQENR